MENKVLKWSLIAGIVVVLNLFFAYTMKVVYQEPQWDQFCQKEQVVKIDTEEACAAEGGQWNVLSYDEEVAYPKGGLGESLIINSCDMNYNCQGNYNDARGDYEKKVFITLITLGVISIIVSFLMTSSFAVSVGLSLGGVLSLIIASMRYWQFASDYLQVGILGLALAILVWLGVKKIK